MPEVTVVIAAYNSSPTLRCALASLRGQTFADFECWVVGDQCTDNSQDVVAEFGDHRLNWVNLPHRVGSQSGPNNEGLRRARGKYVAYLGHDDLWFPEHLANLVTTIEQAPADFAHAAAVCMGPSGPAFAMGTPGTRRSYAQRFVPPSCWLHRRDLFKTCGPWPYPPGQIGGVDFVYQRRAYFAGQRFACTKQITVLKFPSPWWRTYALTSGHPQPEHWARMQQDPRHLREDILRDLIFSETRRREDLPVVELCMATARALFSAVKDWYGLERWPLSCYAVWRAKSLRERARVLRGLPLPVETPQNKDAAILAEAAD